MTALAKKTDAAAQDIIDQRKATKVKGEPVDDKAVEKTAKKKADDTKKKAALDEQHTEDTLRFEELQIATSEQDMEIG